MGSFFSSLASSSSSVNRRKRIFDLYFASLESEDVQEVAVPRFKRRKNNLIQQKISYDLFVSFRGSDTRKNFTSHLLGALRRHCFNIYEDTMLPRGRDVGSELSKAIEESKISVVIFSSNYVDSEWCLDELVNIWDCSKLNEHTILPIFLDVEPSDVKKQQGSYKKAFENHKAKYNQERIQNWRHALKEVGKLSGLHLQNDANGDEAKFIEQIVKRIHKLSGQPNLHVADQPVGVDSRVQELISWLSLDSAGARIIAVWGVGGLGKTTVAKATYCRIAPDFQSHSFIADVRTIFGQTDGKAILQNKLISDLVQYDNSPLIIDNHHHGIVRIKQILSYRKVLLVLDDVDNIEQLKALAINNSSLHPESRIIVTTRDEACLSLLQVSDTYQPSLLEPNESLELFSRHAFGEGHPKEGYEKLSEDVVQCAGGLPLVVEVWGAYLRYFKTVELWKSALNKLTKIPHGDIQAKLKISYDSLDDREKKLFLDIACFLVGMNRNLVVKVSEDEGLGSFPDSEIETLVGRCLVHIQGDQVSMHDVIKNMGREIIRQESEDEPGQRSRLWDRTHVLEVLRACSGTEAVVSISLHSSELEEKVIARVEAFTKMSNLRLIHLDGVHLSTASFNGDMHSFSFRKLKYLRWYWFPLKNINLDMGNPVVIDLQYSKLEILWEGIKYLKKLRYLNVSHSSLLIKTPDFSGLKNLEEMFFRNCTNLEELHSSIGCLDKLVVLDLYNCLRLRKLPLESMCNLRSLQVLDLTNCSCIGYHEDLTYLMSSLKQCCINQLLLVNCNILKLPAEISYLESLQHLDLSNNAFSSLPNSFHNLHCLETIDLSNCVGLSRIPDLPINMSSVTARDCTSLANLPSNMSKLTSLKSCVLDGCLRLGYEEPQCLMKFVGSRCLQHLSMMNCNLSIVPGEIESLLSLDTLDLSGNTFTSLPDNISNLRNLGSLHLNNCVRLKFIPHLPSQLLLLRAVNCVSLDMMPVTQTDKVDFSDCSKLVCDNYANDFRNNILQLYKDFLIDKDIQPKKSIDNINIYLSGTEVPNWCTYQSEGPSISFVAPIHIDRKIRGSFFSAIIPQFDDNDSFALNIEVLNQTNGMKHTFSQCSTRSTATLCLEFCLFRDSELVVEASDSVVVEFQLQFAHKQGRRVKKCGLCLIYEGDESDPVLNNQQMIEYTPDF